VGADPDVISDQARPAGRGNRIVDCDEPRNRAPIEYRPYPSHPLQRTPTFSKLAKTTVDTSMARRFCSSLCNHYVIAPFVRLTTSLSRVSLGAANLLRQKGGLKQSERRKRMFSKR
jgi:hypothetical protein